jgi:hypothetical protein
MTSDEMNSHPMLATALSADRSNWEMDDPHPPPATMARITSPSFGGGFDDPVISDSVTRAASTARVDFNTAASAPVA